MAAAAAAKLDSEPPDLLRFTCARKFFASYDSELPLAEGATSECSPVTATVAAAFEFVGTAKTVGTEGPEAVVVDVDGAMDGTIGELPLEREGTDTDCGGGGEGF